MIKLGTKAETLEALRPHLSLSRICPSVIFTVADWNSDPEAILDRIAAKLSCHSVIVRSSAANEDHSDASLAGAHDSVSDVPMQARETLRGAIGRVVHSYEKTNDADTVKRHNDQVLVQPMVNNVSMSGVIFTQDINTGGPYYVVCYDDVSGRTDTVTTGTDDNRTLIIHRDHASELRSSRFRQLLLAVQEIERLVNAPGLDIEFAVTRDEAIYVFQVRSLAVQDNWNRDTARRCDAALQQVSTFLASHFRSAPGILGHRSIFTEMSDWNPAEMIGVVPRRLAFSLYSTLITNSTWAEARALMGYRDLGGHPLMISLAGRAYIDVRKSFNSFLPKSLTESLGDKLVSHWLDTLQAHPDLHDKIEFEVATTAYPFDFDLRVGRGLQDAGFSNTEIIDFKRALQLLTNAIVTGDTIRTHLDKIDRQAITHVDDKSSTPDIYDCVRTIRQLLRDCREHGTLPFAVLARCAFISEEMLRSLVRLRTLDSEDLRAFRSSVGTVLSDFIAAINALQTGQRSRQSFLAEYGHLRPGTYDITSPRYDHRVDLFVTDDTTMGLRATKKNEFTLPSSKLARVDRVLCDTELTFDAPMMFHFIRESIVGREYAKFRFTRHISDVLELMASVGGQLGLSREELSHLDIADILRIESETPTVGYEDYFRSLAREARNTLALAQAVRLPYLIAQPSDVYIVPLLKSRPNFVTNLTVTRPLVFLSGREIKEPNLYDKIVFIEGADPGYDWIFAKGIAGLITKFGGSNSHMTIRCAELGIPAAIGCGEQIFERLRECIAATIDASSCRLIPIN